jgi:hypothetical protein
MGINLRCRHRPLFAEQFWFSHLEVLLEIGVTSILDSNDVWPLAPPFVFYRILGWFVCPNVKRWIVLEFTMWIIYLDTCCKWLKCDLVGILEKVCIIFIRLSVQNTNRTRNIICVFSFCKADSFEFTNSIVWVNSCFQFVVIAYRRLVSHPISFTRYPIVVLYFSYTFDNFVNCLDSWVIVGDITTCSKMMAHIEVTSSFDSCR